MFPELLTQAYPSADNPDGLFAQFITRASANASGIDALLIWLLISSVLVSAIIYILMIVFSFKYRRGTKANRANANAQSHTVEIAWTSVTLALFLITFFWAANLYTAEQTRPPVKDALNIYVLGKQWMWKLEHPDGQREINELHVPVGRTVRLLMTSKDVIHSFYVPAFRLKQDVLPGTYTTLSFTPTVSGQYALFCAEYCGLDHSRMRGRVIVMKPQDYARWLSRGDVSTSMVARGAQLFRQYGCSGCHFGNSTVHAPVLNGLYGRPVQMMNGSTKIADERYLHDSIVLPKQDIVAGFAPIMPSFEGQISEQEMLQIIAYLKSLAET